MTIHGEIKRQEATAEFHRRMNELSVCTGYDKQHTMEAKRSEQIASWLKELDLRREQGDTPTKEQCIIYLRNIGWLDAYESIAKGDAVEEFIKKLKKRTMAGTYTSGYLAKIYDELGQEYGIVQKQEGRDAI